MKWITASMRTSRVETLSRFGSIVLVVFAVILCLLASQRWRQQIETEALSFLGSAVVILGGAFILWPCSRNPTSSILARFPPATVSIAAICLASGFAIVVGLCNQPESWDEGAYILGGLALRGHPTPYAAHRAPLTHILCALMPHPEHTLNPLLILALALLLMHWAGARMGSVWSATLIGGLLCQDLVLRNSINVMSELPAALLLTAAFYFLGRQSTMLSALSFSLLPLARWNLAVFPVVASIAVWRRYGLKAVGAYFFAGLLTFGTWYALSLNFTDRPIERVYEGNFQPAYEWSASGEEKPDFDRRTTFYLQHWFFLTPLGFVAILASPLVPRTRRAEPTRARGDVGDTWVLRYVAPATIITYGFTMLNMGALFDRFMMPVLPLALVVLWDVVRELAGAGPWRRPSLVVVTTLVMAYGLWPLRSLLVLKQNLNYQQPLSPAFVRKAAHLHAAGPIYAPATADLSVSNGHPIMIGLRRRVEFPGAMRDRTGAVIPVREGSGAVETLREKTMPGATLLLKKSQLPGAQPCEVLVESGEWALCKRGH